MANGIVPKIPNDVVICATAWLKFILEMRGGNGLRADVDRILSDALPNLR